MNKLITLLLLAQVGFVNSQCDSTIVSNDWTVSSDALIGGIYVVEGTFTLQSGVTVYVTPYTSNGCGSLKIYADQIIILGNINGDYAGYPGGTGGLGAQLVSSITGHQAAISSCTDESNQGKITVEGGKAGIFGDGPGGGAAGLNGTSGSGPKQYCGSFGDESGVIGGSGGAGGGAGGSYGSLGSNGGPGGAGTSVTSTNGLTIDDSYPVEGGIGGAGGVAPLAVGTASGWDISLGSGGAGSGGGGRSFNPGSNGNRGGHGGGLIFLQAQNDLVVSGTLTVNGENGGNGGTAGNGDASPGCCSDGCDGCDEKTFSTGAGGGSGAGAGSGGGIYLETLNTATITGLLESNGGSGGNSGAKGVGVTCTYSNFLCSDNSISTGDGAVGAKGGAGSGGRIKVFVPECIDAVVEPTTSVIGGIGFANGGNGTYEVVCGYAAISENELSSLVQIYPNPADDFLNIRISDELYSENVNLSIVDAFGRKVREENIQGESNYTIEISNLDAGYYFVSISTTNKTITTKLIVR